MALLWGMFMAGVTLGVIVGATLSERWLTRALRRYVRGLEEAPYQTLRDMAPVARDAFGL